MAARSSRTLATIRSAAASSAICCITFASGDFVEILLRDARSVDELAFAIGALAHYTNDNVGHPEAVNRGVAIAFPKLRLKFGDHVTYVEAPAQHVIVEFSFDVMQAAGGTYLPQAYQQFIGFRVATDLLARAFVETYGLEMQAVFADADRSIATYRYAVSEIIPSLTEAAWRDKHDEMSDSIPTCSAPGSCSAMAAPHSSASTGATTSAPDGSHDFSGSSIASSRRSGR